MARRGRGLLEVLIFSGHYEQDEQYVYAVCDDVPLSVPGRDEEEADAAMDTALEMYVSMLANRGELRAAIKEFGIEVISLESPRYRPIRCHPHTGRSPAAPRCRR